MAQSYYSSTAQRTTLASSVTNTATTMIVAAVTGWPSSYPYTLVIDQDTINEEVVEVTARSGTTCTVVRAVDSTLGVAHSSGAAVNHGVSARDFSEPNTHVNTAVLHVTVCTSTTRPASPSAGAIIFESDTSLYYGWSGTAWTSIGGSSGGGIQDVLLMMGA